MDCKSERAGETESLPDEYPQSDDEMERGDDWMIWLLGDSWTMAGLRRVCWTGCEALGWGTMTVRGWAMVSFLVSRDLRLSPRWCIREAPKWCTPGVLPPWEVRNWLT